jgi:membrane protein DedA with SNARE-associated domain
MIDLVQWFVAHLGYAGIALLTLVETIFPPLPSEVIIPLAAVSAQQASMNAWGVIAAGTLGSMAGNLFWFALAWRFGMARFSRLVERHGRWFTADWREIERAEGYFLRHGALFICLGRLLPAIRTFISVPAGLAHMPPARFLLWSSLGTAAWTGILAGAGWQLGARYRDIQTVLAPLTAIIILPFVAWYLWRLYKSFRT